MIETITKLVLPINETKRRNYYDWITSTGISCCWDYIHYRKQDYMIIDLSEEDATAFRLVFGYDRTK